MDIRLFTLCDGAFNYNGKISIVGTIDNVKVQQLPFDANIGFAVKLAFPESEAGLKKISLQFLDPDGDDMMPALESDINVLADGGYGKISVAGNLQGLKFTKEGAHTVVLKVNDKVYKLPYNVFVG